MIVLILYITYTNIYIYICLDILYSDFVREKEIFMAEEVPSWGNVGHTLHSGETITPILDVNSFEDYMQ